MSSVSDADDSTERSSRRKQKSPRKKSTSVSAVFTSDFHEATDAVQTIGRDGVVPLIDGTVNCLHQSVETSLLPDKVAVSPASSGQYKCSLVGNNEDTVIRFQSSKSVGNAVGENCIEDVNLPERLDSSYSLSPKTSMKSSLTAVQFSSPLNCSECGRNFQKKHQLDAHVLLRHNLKQCHPCEHCKLVFPLKSLLASHVVKAHVVGAGVTKDISDFLLEQRAVFMYHPEHGTPAIDGPYIRLDECGQAECYLCDFTCDDGVTMKGHFRQAHATWKLALMCPRCMMEFETSAKVAHHQKVYDCMQVTAMFCRPCGLSFDKTEKYMEHVADRHSSNYVQKYRCEKCSKVFRQLFFLKRHAEKCSGATKSAAEHSCGYCSRSFMNRYGLKNHMRSMHFVREGSKRVQEYKCLKCDQVFMTRNEKFRHQSKEHRNHHCSECPRSFVTRAKLRAHMRRHSSQQLPCPICGDGKLYSSEQSVRSHVRRAHTERYPEVYGWEARIRYYVCEVCSRQCSSHGDYTKHMRVHTNERPYVCEYCRSAFKQKRHVKEHMMYKHKAEYEQRFGAIHYKHVCAECDKKFLAKCALTKHMRMHARLQALEQCRVAASAADVIKGAAGAGKKKRSRQRKNKMAAVESGVGTLSEPRAEGESVKNDVSGTPAKKTGRAASKKARGKGSGTDRLRVVMKWSTRSLSPGRGRTTDVRHVVSEGNDKSDDVMDWTVHSSRRRGIVPEFNESDVTRSGTESASGEGEGTDVVRIDVQSDSDREIESKTIGFLNIKTAQSTSLTSGIPH